MGKGGAEEMGGEGREGREGEKCAIKWPMERYVVVKAKNMRQLTLLYLLLCSLTAGAYGIDVSHHQGRIDWDAVPRDVEFVYVKATEGATYVDPMYERNIREARRNGFKVGSYHFFRMTSTPEEQFENIKKYVVKGEQDLRLMIDVETTDGRDVGQVQDSLQVLLNLVEDYFGCEPIIYGTNRRFNGYDLYIGRYNEYWEPIIFGWFKRALIWQYTDKGVVAGVPGKVDLAKGLSSDAVSRLCCRKEEE